MGNLAAEVSERDGASPDSYRPSNQSRCPGCSSRGAQTSRVGAACIHAAGTARTDAANIAKGNAEMSADRQCACSKQRGNSNGSSVGQPFDVARMQDVRQGAGLYQAFNRFDPSRVMKIRQSRMIPPVVVELGELVGLIYRSDKGQLGQPRTYIHRMENPPRLVSNIEGTQLYIVGGNYKVTPRGIEG